MRRSKGNCDQCPAEDVYIAKNHPRLGRFCVKCNNTRLREASPKKTSPKERAWIEDGDNQIKVFEHIWRTRPRVSFVSGRPLTKFNGGPFFLNLFAHVLSKAQNRYPHFKLKPENIQLLHPEEHELFDKGTEEERQEYAKKHHCSWEGLYNLRERLKEEYADLYS